MLVLSTLILNLVYAAPMTLFEVLDKKHQIVESSIQMYMYSQVPKDERKAFVLTDRERKEIRDKIKTTFDTKMQKSFTPAEVNYLTQLYNHQLITRMDSFMQNFQSDSGLPEVKKIIEKRKKNFVPTAGKK